MPYPLVSGSGHFFTALVFTFPFSDGVALQALLTYFKPATAAWESQWILKST
jgi:hypothetical protein